MVKDTRKASAPDACKPVNAPELAQVEEDIRGFPAAVKARRRSLVLAISNRWRIDDEWWRAEPVSRLYFDIYLESGQRLVVYKDLTRGCWYRQPY